MTSKVVFGVLLAVAAFSAGVASASIYWMRNCESISATTTAQLQNVIGYLEERMTSARGPIFEIPLAQTDRSELQEVVQKFTTDLNGNLYMLVAIPTTPELRGTKPSEAPALQDEPSS